MTLSQPTPPIRLIVANGCSMVYGDELADRLRTGWVAVLGRRLGVDFVNLGACAGRRRSVLVPAQLVAV